jgi:membrane protein required for colicin V production
MNALDWILLAGIGASIALGIFRGFMREVISLAGWIAGIWLAFLFAVRLSAPLPFAEDWPLARTAVVAVLIVVVCVFLAAFVGWLVRELMKVAKLSAADRTLGGVFGLARGMLIVALAVFLVRDTELYHEPLWRDSVVLPRIEAALAFALRQLPDTATARVPRA